MLLYRKYIIKNIIPIFLIVTFAITSLVWITQVLKLLYLFDKGIKISLFFNLIILILPSLLFVLLPLITTIAIIYTYNTLKTERQLIILQAFGVNNLRIAIPALYISLFITILAYYISTVIMPQSYINLKTSLNFIKNNYMADMIEEKTFNKISKDISIYIDKKFNNTMSGVIVFDNRNANNQAILFAKLGILNVYDNNARFELNQGSRQAYDNNGNLTQLMFSSLVMQLNTNTNPLIYERNNSDLSSNEYYINELLHPNNELSEQKKIKLITDAHQRIIWPFYNFILPFLALAVFFKYPYNKKASFLPILLVITVILIITTIHFILLNFSAKNLNFIIYCYLNIAIFFIIGLYLFFFKLNTK